MSRRPLSPPQWAEVIGALLAVVGLVLVGLGLLGALGSAFLVEDVAYFGTGGLGGVTCLVLAAVVRVTAASAARCQDLDRLEAGLRRPVDPVGTEEPVARAQVDSIV